MILIKKSQRGHFSITVKKNVEPFGMSEIQIDEGIHALQKSSRASLKSKNASSPDL